MEKEIWKSHTDFENYEFSNWGNFRNTKTGKILKNTISDRGYIETQLYSKSKKKRIKVKLHRMVGELFIPIPEDTNKNNINHIDGIKTNNHYSNLEWISNEENIQHAIDTGLRKRSWAQKINEDDVRTIRKIYDETNLSFADIANQFNVTPSTISSIVKYETFNNIDLEKKYQFKINLPDNQEFIKSKRKKIYKKNPQKNFFKKGPL
jgi:hypothetical protein